MTGRWSIRWLYPGAPRRLAWRIDRDADGTVYRLWLASLFVKLRRAK